MIGYWLAQLADALDQERALLEIERETEAPASSHERYHAAKLALWCISRALRRVANDS